MSNEKQAGRSCGTCYWFKRVERNDYAIIDGLCEWRAPPLIERNLGAHRGKRNEDWCSCWLPNMGAM
jgi:hypothetical protein